MIKGKYQRNVDGTYSITQQFDIENTAIAEKIVPIDLDGPLNPDDPGSTRKDFFIAVQRGVNRFLHYNDSTGLYEELKDRITKVYSLSDPGSAVALLEDTFGAAVGDLNNDGYDDIVASNFPSGGSNVIENQVYINDTHGYFINVTEDCITGSINHDYTRGASLTDINGDSVPEIIFLNDGQNRFMTPVF